MNNVTYFIKLLQSLADIGYQICSEKYDLKCRECGVKADNEKRAKFVRLAEGRVQGALTAIRKIGNLANRRSYDFSDADVKKMMKALRDALSETERKFDPAGSPGAKTFKLQ